MVSVSRMRLARFTFHKALNSSLWFFFIIKARKNGDTAKMVISPTVMLATF